MLAVLVPDPHSSMIFTILKFCSCSSVLVALCQKKKIPLSSQWGFKKKQTVTQLCIYYAISSRETSFIIQPIQSGSLPIVPLKIFLLQVSINVSIFSMFGYFSNKSLNIQEKCPQFRCQIQWALSIHVRHASQEQASQLAILLLETLLSFDFQHL